MKTSWKGHKYQSIYKNVYYKIPLFRVWSRHHIKNGTKCALSVINIPSKTIFVFYLERKAKHLWIIFLVNHLMFPIIIIIFKFMVYHLSTFSYKIFEVFYPKYINYIFSWPFLIKRTKTLCLNWVLSYQNWKLIHILIWKLHHLFGAQYVLVHIITSRLVPVRFLFDF